MNLPNKLTLSRIILIPVFMVVFYLNFKFHYLVALAVFAAASITDFFDGHIARKYDMVTDLGKFMDPIADKVLVLVSLVVILADPYPTSDPQFDPTKQTAYSFLDLEFSELWTISRRCGTGLICNDFILPLEPES